MVLLLAMPGLVDAGGLLTYPKFKAWDSDGDLLVGGKLYTYIPGTSTAKATYSDKNLTTANANPVVLDSAGEATIYLLGMYKLVLKDSSDVTQWTMDNVEGTGEYVTAYYPNPSATDQGATGSSDTIKYYVDTAGANTATIVLKHTAGAASSTYTLSTSESLPSNIRLLIEPGAQLSIGNGITLTLASVDNFVAPPGSEVITGSGTVVFTSGEGKRYTSWWGNDSTALAEAEASCAVGGIIVVDGDMTISTGVVFDVAETVIEEQGDPVITYSGTATAIRIRGWHCVWPDIQINRSALEWNDGTDTTSVGLELYNTRYSKVDVSVANFYAGLKLYGDSTESGVGTQYATMYNTATIHLVYNNQRNIFLTNADANGAVNSNLIEGGNVAYSTAVMTIAVANAITACNLYIAGSPYKCNNNVINCVALQGAVDSTYQQLFYVDGVQNDLINCRLEPYTYTGTYTFGRFGANSLYNKASFGRWPSGYTLATMILDEGSRNWAIMDDRMDMGTISEFKAGAIRSIGNYDVVSHFTAESQFEAKNTNSANKYLWSGMTTLDEETSWIRGFGQVGIGLPRADADGNDGSAYIAMEQLKACTFDQSWTNQDWRRTTAHRSSTDANAVLLWRATVPDDAVMQVIVHLVGRKSDNTRYVQAVLRGVWKAASGTATLGASNYTDPAALNVGTFDVTDIYMSASGAYANIYVGGNEAATFYFSAMIDWQIVATNS